MKVMDSYLKILKLALILFLVGCNTEPVSLSIPEMETLEEYETIIAVEDAILATPNVIKYSGESSLFIYDAGQSKVIEIGLDGNEITNFGRTGRGPGEFQRINNIFYINENLYIVDYLQFKINKYNRNGDFLSTTNYRLSTVRPNSPPVPFSSTTILASNLDNQPMVTLEGDILISSVNFTQNISVQTVYELRNWDMEFITGMGEIPDGASFIIDDEKMRSDISNHLVPAVAKANAFPVLDIENRSEFYLVYSAIPKIDKYDKTGQKIWESVITGIPENERREAMYYENMESVLSSNPQSRTALSYYRSGLSCANGELFLTFGTNPLILHQFDGSGNLSSRYQLISEGIELKPILDIDCTKRRMFVVTEEAEIRAYNF